MRRKGAGRISHFEKGKILKFYCVSLLAPFLRKEANKMKFFRSLVFKCPFPFPLRLFVRIIVLLSPLFPLFLSLSPPPPLSGIDGRGAHTWSEALTWLSRGLLGVILKLKGGVKIRAWFSFRAWSKHVVVLVTWLSRAVLRVTGHPLISSFLHKSPLLPFSFSSSSSFPKLGCNSKWKVSPCSMATSLLLVARNHPGASTSRPVPYIEHRIIFYLMLPFPPPFSFRTCRGRLRKF